MNQRLLLAGGGHSHVEVLRRWALAPEPGTTVTLISPDRFTAYSGMLPGLIAGHYRHDECHIDLDVLCAAAGATRIAALVTALDPATRQVTTSRGETLAYDWLAIDVGSTPATAGIQGAGRHGIAVRPVARFLVQWDELRAATLTAPRELELVVVGGGAAGVEVVLAMQQRIAADGGRARFTLVGDGAGLMPAHPAAVGRRFRQLLDERGIRLCLGQPVSRVAAGTLELADGTALPFDDVFWITGAGAPSWPRLSGLDCDARGFILVDVTLRSVSHPQVFASGDIAGMIDAPRPKSGVYAVRQGPPLHDNLRCALRGQPLRDYRPQPRALALIGCGDRSAVAVYGPLSWHGRWVWRWKNRIDRAFMARYHGG
jgi:selenide,water dikinase